MAPTLAAVLVMLKKIQPVMSRSWNIVKGDLAVVLDTFPRPLRPLGSLRWRWRADQHHPRLLWQPCLQVILQQLYLKIAKGHKIPVTNIAMSPLPSLCTAFPHSPKGTSVFKANAISAPKRAIKGIRGGLGYWSLVGRLIWWLWFCDPSLNMGTEFWTKKTQRKSYAD